MDKIMAAKPEDLSLMRTYMVEGEHKVLQVVR